MAKYPEIAHTPRTLGNTDAEAQQGTTHESGVPFPVNASQRAGVAGYSRIGDENRRWELVNDRILQNTMQLAAEATTTALQLAVAEGFYSKQDNTKVEFAGGTLSIPDATSGRLVWIDVASNTLAQGAAWPATEADYRPIAIVDTAGGAITQIKDARTYSTNRVAPSVTDVGATNQTDFVIDADNAGAGTTTRVRFNRGSTDDDAAIVWDETNDKFVCYLDYVNAVLAPLDVLSIAISGTTMLDSNGAAKVAAAVAGDGLAHAAGVLAVNPDGTTLEISADAVRIKDGGVTAAKLSNAVADLICQVTITDHSGSGSTYTVSIQVLDAQGNALNEEVLLRFGVYQDDDGEATATNATIDNTPVTGTWEGWVTTNKVARYRTSNTGLLQVDVAMPTNETVYTFAGMTDGSPLLDCRDRGSITKS